MMCEKCRQADASVHLSLFEGGCEVHRFCEPCAREFLESSHDPRMAGFRWQLYGIQTEGFVNMRARIIRIERETFVVHVIKSSHFPDDSELTFRRGLVSDETWNVGVELNFICTVDELKALIGSA